MRRWPLVFMELRHFCYKVRSWLVDWPHVTFCYPRMPWMDYNFERLQVLQLRRKIVVDDRFD